MISLRELHQFYKICKTLKLFNEELKKELKENQRLGINNWYLKDGKIVKENVHAARE